jgi:predicted ester cyclase
MLGGCVSSEQNKGIVRQFIEDFFNTGDPDIADEPLSDDYVDHSPSHPTLSGPENAKQSISEWLSAFPDTVSVGQDMVAEGDRVAARWTTQPTHQGEFMDFTPTAAVKNIDPDEVVDRVPAVST